MNANIISILKAIHTDNNTIVNKDTWTALFEALTQAESDRMTFEVAFDEAEAPLEERSAESDYNTDVNDADYNLSVKAGNAYRKAEAARRVEAILIKAIEDIYREGHVEIEKEV